MTDDTAPRPTLEADALAERLARLEAWATAQQQARIEARAAPPITIGPFTNVPAPGSPIRSDWPQTTATYLAKNGRGLVGTGTKAGGQGGFAQTELDISCTVAVPAGTGRIYAIAYQITVVATAATGPVVAGLNVRARAGSSAGALLGAQTHPYASDWAAGPWLFGQFPPLGLAAGTVVSLTFNASSGTFTVGPAAVALYDVAGP